MNLPLRGSRRRLSFKSINRPGARDYDPGLQRHHLIPRQAQTKPCFASLFNAVGECRIGFDDFRVNGLLLPASDAAALRLAMPLHRGPHRRYSGMVIERIGRVEAAWARDRLRRGLDHACEQALMQLNLIQRALRRRLLQGAAGAFVLSRRDPNCRNVDFSELDAMADLLWTETQSVPSLPASSRLAARYSA
jgi:hypothetical protein